ncbi:MAG: hypothetical protein IPK26_03440 [Planctomycetes bacterium]|nr:hypothetical protein [Planctomycetota bacterium]
MFGGAFADGAFELRGVTAGRHQVIVAGTDHLAKIHDLVFAEGEARALAVTLSERPR